MNRLETAQQKFDAALARLDAAVKARKDLPAPAPAPAAADDNALMAEKTKLEAEVAALRQINRQVAGRLDLTIRKVNTLLDGQAKK